MSAQPWSTTPAWLADPTRVESYGSNTSQTLRFAAGALDAMRSVTRGVPETCTVSEKIGVAYNKRFDDCSTLASALPLCATSSENLSVPVAGERESGAMPVPPAVGRKDTGTA